MGVFNWGDPTVIIHLLILVNYYSEGNGASFPLHGSTSVSYLTRPSSNHGNHHEDGMVIFDKAGGGGSDSEVEIYAVDDHSQETQLLHSAN